MKTASISAHEMLQTQKDYREFIALENRRLAEAGFDLSRPIHREYNPLTGSMHYAQKELPCQT